MSSNGSGDGKYKQVKRLEDGTDKGSNQNIRNVYQDYMDYWANDVGIHLGLCGNFRKVEVLPEGKVVYEVVLRLSYQGAALREAVHGWTEKLKAFEPFAERDIKIGKVRYLASAQVIPFTVRLTPLDVEYYFARQLEVDKFKRIAAETAERRAKGLS